jgi:hypothetical protein
VANVRPGLGRIGRRLDPAGGDEDQGLPLRTSPCSTVRRGCNAAGRKSSINVSGFLTPASGTVNTRLGLATTEGDLGLTGDTFSFKDASSPTFTTLSTSTSPADNFHNSTISDLGLIGEGSIPKFPDYINQLGFSADRVQATGILKNNSTGAQIRFSTVGDTYDPFAVTFVTDIFEPQIKAMKSVLDVNGGP